MTPICRDLLITIISLLIFGAVENKSNEIILTYLSLDISTNNFLQFFFYTYLYYFMLIRSGKKTKGREKKWISDVISHIRSDKAYLNFFFAFWLLLSHLCEKRYSKYLRELPKVSFSKNSCVFFLKCDVIIPDVWCIISLKIRRVLIICTSECAMHSLNFNFLDFFPLEHANKCTYCI